MRLLLNLILVPVLLLLAGFALMLGGVYDVSATREDPALLRWVLETTKERSLEVRAAKVVKPEERASSPESVAVLFQSLCVPCHGGPGVHRSPIGIGLYPKPPDLLEAAEDEEEELYWAIRHGIKMTGMPAFGPTHRDEDVWGLVAFVKGLPDLSPVEYRRLAGISPEGAETPAGEEAPGPTGQRD